MDPSECLSNELRTRSPKISLNIGGEGVGKEREERDTENAVTRRRQYYLAL